MDIKLQEALINIAHQDLRDARAEGEIAICNTKLGTLCLGYNRAKGTYTINPVSISQTMSDLTIDQAVYELVHSYEVEVD